MALDTKLSSVILIAVRDLIGPIVSIMINRIKR